MDNKYFVVRIGWFLPGWTGFGVPIRSVDGGLACNGSGIALDSPGVMALIGYHVAFPSPFSRLWGQKVYSKSRKGEAELIRSGSGYGARVDEFRHFVTLDKGMKEVTNLVDTLVCCALQSPYIDSAVERSRLLGGSRAPQLDLALGSIAYHTFIRHQSHYFGLNLAALDL